MSHARFARPVVACVIWSLGATSASQGRALQLERAPAPVVQAERSPPSGPAASVPCGPACVAIISRLLGIEIQNESLASIADDQGESSFDDLARYMNSRGLYTVALQTTPAQLPSLPGVCILHVRVAPTPGEVSGSHFVVLLPGGPTGHSYVLDPTESGVLMPARMDLLVNKWTGKALLVSQTPVSLDAVLPSNDPCRSWDYAHAIVGLVAGGALGLALCRMIGLRLPVRDSSATIARPAPGSAAK